MGRKRKVTLLRSLLDHFTYSQFRIWFVASKLLPIRSLPFYGEKLGSVVFRLFWKPRKIALHNLHLALGNEKSEEEMAQICRESFRNIGRDMMETSRSLDYEDSYFGKLVKIEGEEHLDKALEQGKGVIALSAHVGNFPLMAVRLARKGYPLSVVAKISKDPKIIKFMASLTRPVGLEFIPDKPRMACVTRCIKALRENRMLMVQIDLNAPGTEAWVDFFGYLVPTYKGPVIFSNRTGAPIIPMFIIRKAHHLHHITIHPPCVLNATEDREPDIISNTARLTKIVEATIREHPEQWWWVHRRFKRAKDIQTGESIRDRMKGPA